MFPIDHNYPLYVSNEYGGVSIEFDRETSLDELFCALSICDELVGSALCWSKLPVNLFLFECFDLL